ncbi:MAG: hypothetical protein HXS44_16820 [Theionarchaea archaeon]|nr:hypothetical protein [Theionarchaea archaeon]
MMRMVIRTWNRNNRAEKIEEILRTLNQTGLARVEYFKEGSSLKALVLPGRTLQEVTSNEWSHVRGSYQGENAFEIFDSVFGPYGYFFDENFDQGEIQEILNAFCSAGISVFDSSPKGKKVLILVHSFVALLGLAGVVYGFVHGNLLLVISYSLFMLGSLLLLILRYRRKKTHRLAGQELNP